MNDLFARHGFETEFFGDMPVEDVPVQQRVLRPIKKLAVMLKIMPKTMAGKKFFKKIMFGGLVEMPVEIGPRITQIARNKQKKENTSDLYRGHYMESDRITGREPDKMHKVIYCVATLDLQISQINKGIKNTGAC